MRKRKACVAAVDEAILDISRAIKLLGYDDPAAEYNMIVETIIKNHIVQRIYTQSGVLYFRETGPKWIRSRIDQAVKKGYI